MSSLPPSPFLSAVFSEFTAVTAAATMTPSLPTAAAEPFAEPDEHRFVLDEDAFRAELADEMVREALRQQMPVFLRAPSPEFLQGVRE